MLKTYSALLRKFRDILSADEKKKLVLIVLFAVFVSVIETVGISLVIPFVNLVNNINSIETLPYFHAAYKALGFNSPVYFVLFFGAMIILYFAFRGLVVFLYYKKLAGFVQGFYLHFASRLFDNYIKLDYERFNMSSIPDMTKSIVNEAYNVILFISAFMFIFSEVFIVLFLYCLMMMIDVSMTLIFTVIALLSVYIMVSTISKVVRLSGEKKAECQKEFYEIVSSAFGNFKICKMRSSADKVIELFEGTSRRFVRAHATNESLAQVPRLFLESIGFGLIILILMFLVWKYDGNIQEIIAVLTVFVFALYRMLPSVNRILNAFNLLSFHSKSLEIVHENYFLPTEALGGEKIEFNDNIRLDGVSFTYSGGSQVLSDIDLDIKKGSRVAFMGESGSGKSTLVNIIISLLKCTKGRVLVDGVALSPANMKSYRKKIGYIPQHVYLFNGTVAENVIFEEEYDEEKLIKVLRKAHIWDFLQSKDGLNTQVGDAGVLLSGGQLQRIALARALYHEPEILVLDEATSALDNETEKNIMSEVYGLSREITLIIIAHRLSTIKNCEKVYLVENGKVRETTVE